MDGEITKIIEAARELLKIYGYYMDHMWHVSDIHLLCEQHGFPKLSDSEAMEVFSIASEQFEGEYGISWPQLEKALVTYMQREELIKGWSKKMCDG